MIQRRRFRPFAMALALFAVACLSGGRNLYGQNQTSSAAQTRAEIERKSREIKKTVEAHRKEVADRQRDVRERLGLPNSSNSTSGGSGTASTNSTSSRLPGSEALPRDMKLSDPRSLAKTAAPGRKKNAVQYSPQRGQEFAFLVEMSTREGGLHKQWTGTPYFAGVFSDVGRSFAEMFCIGNLACRIRSSADRPWSPASIDDIELPQSFMFGSSGVMNARTTSMFDQPVLPLQLSAILPVEELIFPRLPTFSDSRRNDSKERATYYLRGGQKSVLGYVPISTTLDGESRRVCRIEQENSTTPQIVNERAFSCPAEGVELSFRQVGSIDARDGMIRDVDLDYFLKLDGDARLTVKVRRLFGDDLTKARDEAFKRLPHTAWPSYFRRIPEEGDRYGQRLPRSAGDIPAGQQVSVSIEIVERDVHGSRDYLAKTIAGAPAGKVRVRLDGSNEELDVSPSHLHLSK